MCCDSLLEFFLCRVGVSVGLQVYPLSRHCRAPRCGITSVPEDQFGKETGMRVFDVGTGTGAVLKMAENGQLTQEGAKASLASEHISSHSYIKKNSY